MYGAVPNNDSKCIDNNDNNVDDNAMTTDTECNVMIRRSLVLHNNNPITRRLLLYDHDSSVSTRVRFGPTV